MGGLNCVVPQEGGVCVCIARHRATAPPRRAIPPAARLAPPPYCGPFLLPLVFSGTHSHMRLPPKSAVLRTDDLPGHPIGSGAVPIWAAWRALAGASRRRRRREGRQGARTATKLCLVQPERVVMHYITAAIGLWHLNAGILFPRKCPCP
jgi:hypothetical protein